MGLILDNLFARFFGEDALRTTLTIRANLIPLIIILILADVLLMVLVSWGVHSWLS
jgi:hypothetical protein